MKTPVIYPFLLILSVTLVSSKKDRGDKSCAQNGHQQARGDAAWMWQCLRCPSSCQIMVKFLATGAKLKTAAAKDCLNISLPLTAFDAIASVIKIEVKGKVILN